MGARPALFAPDEDRAFVEFFANDNAVYRSLDKLQQRFSHFGGFLMKVGGVTAGLGAAIVAPLGAIFWETVNSLDEVKKASDRLGTSPEVIAQLGHAADLSGVQFEALESALGKMQKSIFAASQGGDDSAFKRMGLDAKELLQLPLEEQYAAIADGMARLENATVRGATAMGIFGKSGRALLPMLKDGAEGLRGMMGEVATEGLGEAAGKAERIQDAFSRMKAALLTIPKAVAIGFFDFVGDLEEGARVVRQVAGEIRGFVRANAALFQTLAAVGAALVIGGGTLIAFGLAFKGVALGIGAVVAIVQGGFAIIAGAVGFLLTPLGAVVGLVVALGVIWATTTDSGKRAGAALEDGFRGIARTFAVTFGGITDALRSGDMALAGEVAFAGLAAVWAEALAAMQKAWDEFKQNSDVGKWVRDVQRALEFNARAPVEKGGPQEFLTDVVAGWTAIAIAVTDSEKAAIDFVKQLEAVKGEEDDLVKAQRKRYQEELEREAAKKKKLAEDKAAEAKQKRVGMEAASAAEMASGLVARVFDEMFRRRGPLAAIADSTKGGFGGQIAAQQFAFGDKSVQQKQLDAQEEIAANTDAMKDRLDGIEPLRFA